MMTPNCVPCANSHLINYFKNDLGLTLPDIVVAPHSLYLSLCDQCDHPAAQQLLERLRRHPGEWIDGYVTDKMLVRIGEKSGRNPVSSHQGSHNGNNKLLLCDHLESLDLPVFDTFRVTSPQDLGDHFQTLKELGYQKAVVKSSIGASGIGMRKYDLIDDPVPAAPLPDYFFFEGPCLVQG